MLRLLTFLISELVAFIVTFAATGAASSRLLDCTIRIDRRPLPGFVPRIVPAPDVDGLAVVWQDSETIHLQRFDHDCSNQADAVAVNTTRDFWREPRESGLSDAVGLGGRATVVAWTLGGDVWVRVVRVGQSDSTWSAAVPANNRSRRYRRQDVRVVANSSSGFIVAWTSWQEDGDGWGIFARSFTAEGVPLDAQELQVNQAWRHFQWRPQLLWCRNSLWAMWANGTDGSCQGADCATGPFARRLASNRSSGLAVEYQETKLKGKGPLASALSCVNDEDSDDAKVFWLDRGGEMVTSKKVLAEPKHPAEADATEEEGIVRRLASSFLSLSSERSNRSMSLVMSLLHQVSAHVLGSASGALGATDSIDVGQVVMTAYHDLLVLLSNDGHGGLYAQLLNFAAIPKPVAYPKRQIATGSQLARAAWVTKEMALVMCWSQGGLVEAKDASQFICAQRKAQWLVDAGGLELGGKLALVIVLSLVGVFCCVRHFTGGGRLNRLPRGRRFMPGDEVRRSRRLASQARLRELREQLAQIPTAMEPVQGQADASCRPDAEGDGPASASLELDNNVESNASTSSIRWTSSRISGDVCSICQNEVAVWVALRPCGHTACRECVLRIVEMNQRCHLCRSPIEGVLPVYL